MDEKFRYLIEGLHRKYEALVAMKPLTIATVPTDSPKGGVYLFSEGGRNLYAGRTKRSIRERLKYHAEYDKAKERIRTMEVRYVGEPDPLKQALLEIYVAVTSRSEHNDFDTH